ncbi:unnamed protein product, partial [Polarella glacialis]
TGSVIAKARVTAGNAQSSLPAWSYLFQQDQLSTKHAFILGDSGVTYEGATIRYASRGCCELFELDATDLGIIRCQNLVGYQCVSRHVGALAAQVGMDLQQVKERLQFVHDSLIQEVSLSLGSWDKPSSHLGCTLGLCYKAKAGTFFVCELVMLCRTEPHTSWPYFACFHRDVTHEVPVKRLLEAAHPTGGFEQLVREHRSSKPAVFESWDIATNCDGGVFHYLDEKAFDVWTGMVKDALWIPGLDAHPTKSRSLDPDPDRLPDWAYTVIQGGLSDQQSFTICDNGISAEGLTILYVSSGFRDLFECNASEFLGTRSCYQCIDTQVVMAAHTLGMSVQELQERIQYMHKYFVQQSAEQVGFALLLACSRSGTLFVCAVTLMSRTEQATAWRYSTLLQADVTNEVGIQRLIEAACPKGGFDQLVQE